MRYLYLIIGFLFLAIGLVGVVLPVLPTTPFLLVTAFCFAKGSKRFHNWFTGTKLYKKHLDGYIRERAMTLKTKLSILILASSMMIITFFVINVLSAKIFLIFAILFHWWYFFFRIETK
ncbi:YbaN family protein [Tissierella praeacuta]|uniref:YbaN family protein n=1 Tax=Tissierella praeacuta TaxID=43131 RepID=UPI003342278B